MKLTIYHLKSCETCRKAIKALRRAGHSLELIDVRADGVSSETLKRFALAVGYDMLLNKRSTTWRDLPESDKVDQTDGQKQALLEAHPTLIKRPVIDNAGAISVGWADPVQNMFL